MATCNGGRTADKWQAGIRQVARRSQPTWPYDRGVIASGRTSANRLVERLGIQLDEFLAFGLVPIACAALGPAIIEWTWPSAVFVLLALCIGSAVAVARHRGYPAGRTTWFGFVGLLAFLGWGLFVSWVSSVLAA